MTGVDQSSGVRLLLIFFHAFPRRTLFVLGGMLFAGAAEGFGIATILPLLTHLTDEGSTAGSLIGDFFERALGMIGLSPSIALLLVIMVLSLWLKGATTFFIMRQVDYTVAQIATDIRLSLVRALMAARWSYYVSQPTGTFANAISTEAHRASAAYASGCRMVAAGVEAAVYMFLALLVSWQVAVAAAAAGALIIIVLARLIQSMRIAGKRQAASFNALVERLTDGLQGIKPLKAMAREDALGPLLEAEANTLNRTMRQQAQAAEAMRAMQEPLLVVFLAVGLFVVLSVWHIPVALALVMAFLFYRTVNRIGLLQAYYQGVAGTESFYHAIMKKIEEARQAREPTYGSTAPTFSEAVTFDHVSFSYGGHKVLRDVSLTIPARKITVLIGPSGAGKTTLTDLLLGLLTPDRGAILVDGVSLGDIDIKTWRREIGYVPQEMFLFHDTILTNVGLGEADLTADDVKEALSAVDALEFVSAMPEGVNTIVGERGTKISGGQRQRIAMARALVHKPRLLILDEPTTALDPETEAAICRTLHTLGSRCTVLIISHQPALIEIADIVYRMADGVIEPVKPVPADSHRIAVR